MNDAEPAACHAALGVMWAIFALRLNRVADRIADRFSKAEGKDQTWLPPRLAEAGGRDGQVGFAPDPVELRAHDVGLGALPLPTE